MSSTTSLDARVDYANDGFDLGNRRFMTEGEFTLNGRPSFNVGVYELHDRTFVREATVTLPRPRSGTIRVGDLVDAVDAELASRED